jgi:Lipoprotein LpqB beta-propeller domain
VRRRWWVVAGLVAALVVPASCGVPGGGSPVDLGNAPTAGPAQPGASLELPKPTPGMRPAELVTKFFEAAAWGNTTGGDRPNALADAQDSARAFLADGTSWKPGNEVHVARVVVDEAKQVGDGAFDVKVSITPIGKLMDTGQLDSDPSSQPLPFTSFRVVSARGGGFRLATVPDGMWLSLAALHNWYDEHPIYFWDRADGPTLVPDLRYMPKVISPAKRPDEIKRWLLAGPSNWLLDAVHEFGAKGIEIKDKIVFDQQRLVVNLTNDAAAVDDAVLRNLAIQLRWSFGPTFDLDLRVRNTPSGVSSDGFEAANRAARNDGVVEKFCVVDGKARSTLLGGAKATPVLEDEHNAGVVSAAVTGDRTRAALVVREGTGDRLYLGATIGKGDAAKTTYAPTDVFTDKQIKTISKPTWIFRPDVRALVVLDGRIFSVAAPSGPEMVHKTEVVTPPLLKHVSALAVAPDGRRIALVSGGHVYVGTLMFPGTSGGALAIDNQLREVVTGLGSASAVGWGSETSLEVGGKPAAGSSVSLFGVSVDGAGEKPRPQLVAASLEVTSVSTRPTNPLVKGSGYVIMIEANNQAWDVYGTSVGMLSVDLPSPSPSATPNGHPSLPTAPFFLD